MIKRIIITLKKVFSNLMKPKYPLVRQYDQLDCAPASLLSVLKYYGGDNNMVHVRELTNTNLTGSSMLDLVKGAEALGFEAHGVTGRYEDLLQEKMPSIAHVILDDRLQHFVVIYKIDTKKVLLGDPARGKYRMPKQEFMKIWKSKAVILLKPGRKITRNTQSNAFHWLLRYLYKERSWLYQSLFLGILYTSFGLLTAVFIQALVDQFIPAQDHVKITLTGVFLFLLLILKAFAGYFRNRFLVILNKRISITINADFICHLFQLPKRFFDSHKIGDITARMNDAAKIHHATLHIVGTTIIDLLIIIGSFLFMFRFSTNLAWITLILIPVYSAVLVVSVRRIKVQQNDVMKSYAQVESLYFDSLKGVDEILSFNVDHVFSALNKKCYALYQDKMEMLGFTRSRLTLSAEVSNAMIMMGILTTAAILVINSKLMLGKMIAAYALLANMLPAVNSLIDANIAFQGASIALKRLMDLLHVKKEKRGGLKSFKMVKSLIIRDGRFSWTNNSPFLLKINFEIKKGWITGLCGPNGSGKSTLVQILQRKYELAGGTMVLDEIPVAEIDLVDYRKHIGIIPANIKIFNATLVDNILLGRPLRSITHLEKSLDSFGLSSFISSFENDLFTILGEDGRHLSQGEKQMLGLARALFDTPDIIILDEGINSLDIQIENMISNIIRDYAQDHAVLLITHRVATLLKTDHLYILQDGRIVQEGGAEELLKQEGYFKKIWKLHKETYS